MKNILSNKKTAMILLVVTILSLGFYVYMLVRPISYGMEYHNEMVYDGVVYEGSLAYTADGKVISENSYSDEPQEIYYYYKDGYVFHLMATNDEEYKDEVAYINENFDEAVNNRFYAFTINAFKQVPVGLDDAAATYTCMGAYIFAAVGGAVLLALISLTAISFVLFQKGKDTE